MSSAQAYSANYSNNAVESRMAGSWSAHAAKTAAAPVASGEPLSFMDFIKGAIDVINPLQHIPVVGAIYRHLTGDEIGIAARVAGGTLFGGPVGGGLALADVAYESKTGASVGETMIAMMTGKEKEKTAPAVDDAVMIAQNLDTTIAPAAGLGPNDIVWNDAPTPTASVMTVAAAPVFLVSSRPLPSPTLPTPEVADGTGPTWQVSIPTTPSAPSLQGQAATVTLAAAPKAPPAVVHLPAFSQSAPAAPRTDMPPELTAEKMMDALDKYQKLKKEPDGMLLSAGY